MTWKNQILFYRINDSGGNLTWSGLFLTCNVNFLQDLHWGKTSVPSPVGVSRQEGDWRGPALPRPLSVSGTRLLPRDRQSWQDQSVRSLPTLRPPKLSQVSRSSQRLQTQAEVKLISLPRPVQPAASALPPTLRSWKLISCRILISLPSSP